MFLVRYEPLTDPWYNLGQIAGISLGKAYEARTAREAGKQNEYQMAEELYALQNKDNENLGTAYTAYDMAKRNLISGLELARKNYQDNPNEETKGILANYVQKVTPGVEFSDNAVTNAFNAAHSGTAASLQPARENAQAAARKINPYVDFSSSDWGTATYQMGVNRANYTKNFKESNRGKTINGKGDKAYKHFPDYNATNPYQASINNPLGQATPLQFNLGNQQQGAPQMSLQQANPLGGNYFNFGGLQPYVRK